MQRDVDLGFSQLRSQEKAAIRARADLVRARTLLRDLGGRLPAHFSNPVTYVAGINFMAEVHQRVSDLQNRSDQADLAVLNAKAELRLKWRRADMLDEHMKRESLAHREQTLRRTGMEADALWATSTSWQRSVA